MQQILPEVYHWTTFHEGIGAPVHSYYLADTEPAVLIDPRVPDEGLEWFVDHAPPAHIYLTNRLHYRHSDRFSRAFDAPVWCHQAGLHHFDETRPVRGFEHGQRLPGDILALAIDALCPEETAFYIARHGGLLAIGDAIVRDGEALAFVPDELMGDDPGGVKQGLQAAFTRHLGRDFEHLLFAHGDPWLGHGKAALAGFLALAAAY